MITFHPKGCYDKCTKIIKYNNNSISVNDSIGATVSSGKSTNAYSHYGECTVQNFLIGNGKMSKWEDTIGPIFDIVFLFNNILICANSTGIYYSTNNGDSVTKSNISNVAIKDFYNIDNKGVIALTKSNTTYFSSDGKSWVSSNLTNFINTEIEYENINKLPNGTYLFGLGNSSTQIGYTSNYGKTWNIKNLPASMTLNKFIYTKISGKDIYVVGLSAGLGYFENFNNSAISQSNIKTGNFDFIKVITFQGVTSIYASDGSGLYISTDGKTWTKDSVVATNEKIIGAEVIKSRIVFMTSSGNIYYKGTISRYFKK